MQTQTTQGGEITAPGHTGTAGWVTATIAALGFCTAAFAPSVTTWWMVSSGLTLALCAVSVRRELSPAAIVQPPNTNALLAAALFAGCALVALGALTHASAGPDDIAPLTGACAVALGSAIALRGLAVKDGQSPVIPRGCFERCVWAMAAVAFSVTLIMLASA